MGSLAKMEFGFGGNGLHRNLLNVMDIIRRNDSHGSNVCKLLIINNIGLYPHIFARMGLISPSRPQKFCSRGLEVDPVGWGDRPAAANFP